MKVTSFEISKKLAEIGFKAEHSFSWYKNDKDQICLYSKSGTYTFLKDEDGIEKVEASYDLSSPAFCLETILEALPQEMNGDEELQLKKDKIGYYYFEYDHVACGMIVEKEEGKSMADIAAILLISLHKEGIIKFN